MLIKYTDTRIHWTNHAGMHGIHCITTIYDEYKCSVKFRILANGP